jgi:hypothetical protein
MTTNGLFAKELEQPACEAVLNIVPSVSPFLAPVCDVVHDLTQEETVLFTLTTGSPHISVGLETKYWLRDWGLIPDRCKGIFSIDIVQTNSGALPASYSTDIVGCFLVG